MKILFVCRGNVGRSQIAEAIFCKLTVEGYSASSAGTKLSGPSQTLATLPLAEFVIEVMKEEGVDVSNCFRKEITQEMIQEADKVILLATSDESNPYIESLRKNERTVVWDVQDPKGTDIEFHRRTREEIRRRVGKLVGR